MPLFSPTKLDIVLAAPQGWLEVWLENQNAILSNEVK